MLQRSTSYTNMDIKLYENHLPKPIISTDRSYTFIYFPLCGVSQFHMHQIHGMHSTATPHKPFIRPPLGTPLLQMVRDYNHLPTYHFPLVFSMIHPASYLLLLINDSLHFPSTVNLEYMLSHHESFTHPDMLTERGNSKFAHKQNKQCHSSNNRKFGQHSCINSSYL